MSCGVPTSAYTREDMLTLNTMDSTLKNILNDWLKYGCALLTYQAGIRYFIIKQGPFVDSATLRLAVYLLLGFTIYHLVVAPYLHISLTHPILREAAGDVVYFGTALVSAKAISALFSEGGFINNMKDTNWLYQTGALLTGLLVYRLLAFPFIPQDLVPQPYRPAMNDTFQFATMLIVSNALNNNAWDKNFVIQLISLLLGFNVYHLAVKKLITVN